MLILVQIGPKCFGCGSVHSSCPTQVSPYTFDSRHECRRRIPLFDTLGSKHRIYFRVGERKNRPCPGGGLRVCSPSTEMSEQGIFQSQPALVMGLVIVLFELVLYAVSWFHPVPVYDLLFLLSCTGPGSQPGMPYNCSKVSVSRSSHLPLSFATNSTIQELVVVLILFLSYRTMNLGTVIRVSVLPLIGTQPIRASVPRAFTGRSASWRTQTTVTMWNTSYGTEVFST